MTHNSARCLHQRGPGKHPEGVIIGFSLWDEGRTFQAAVLMMEGCSRIDSVIKAEGARQTRYEI